MKKIDCNFFPGWVRKSITFTIDDGNIPLDRKFLSIVKPAGLKGSFNLCTPLEWGLSPEGYREFYRGYEITNHNYHHAYPLAKKFEEREIRNEPFNEATADVNCLYATEEKGFYRVRTWGWTYLADDDAFKAGIRSTTEELEAIFGKGTVKDFVWPNGEQDSDTIKEWLFHQAGFRSVRKTGCVEDTTGFALPADRMRWSYNANYEDMTAVAAKYETFPDDGNLKFFAFGVHSHDFENAGRWDVLIDFCEKYGNRPENYWYAAVGEIFDYEDAVKAIEITDTAVKNPSDVDLFIKIDGKRVTLRAKSEITL